jgi:hypothetical protein
VGVVVAGFRVFSHRLFGRLLVGDVSGMKPFWVNVKAEVPV